jgi:hypothetical protein
MFLFAQNPSNRDRQVSIDDFKNINVVQMKLYEITDKEIWIKTCPINNYSNVTTPSNSLPIGVYTLKIITANQNSSYKFIKE